MVFKIFLVTLRRLFDRVQSFFCSSEMKKNAQTGFTLVELLTVISIMALISSIMLANTLEAKRSAEDTKAIQDVKSLVKVVQAYYLDHGYYPSLTASQAASAGNKYSCGEKICDYDSQTDSTTCDGINICRCPGTIEERLQRGWLPMLDGTLNSSDAYFTPRSTPRDKRQLSCVGIPGGAGLIKMFRYETGFDAAASKYFIKLYYLIHRPRQGAVGHIAACNFFDICAYIINENEISL